MRIAGVTGRTANQTGTEEREGDGRLGAEVCLPIVVRQVAAETAARFGSSRSGQRFFACPKRLNVPRAGKVSMLHRHDTAFFVVFSIWTFCENDDMFVGKSIDLLLFSNG
jgi:hypothetical protein